LQAKAGEFRAAHGWDWSDRPDLLPAMENAYGPFVFKDKTLYNGQLVYEILINDEGDVTLGYTTDPQLENENIFALEDDKNIWPAYHLVPIVKQETLDRYPEIEEIINNISKKLDTETAIELSADVVIRHEEVADVAKSFYEEQVK
jgi:osmoprotectant transport system substrate-binding protein